MKCLSDTSIKSGILVNVKVLTSWELSARTKCERDYRPYKIGPY